MSKHHTIKLGQACEEEIGPYGPKVTFTYTGMLPGNTVFDITYGLIGHVPGKLVHYPVGTKTLEYGDRKFRVINVTPEELIVEYLGKADKK